MIPMRAYHLQNQPRLVKLFDPCAVGLINRLIELSGAKIVVSSTWRQDGYDKCAKLFKDNNIDPVHFHEDWCTPPRRMSDSRTTEILQWLNNHPEVTTYVAIDDEELDSYALPYCIKCDTYEGFSWRNYIECKMYLQCVHEGEDLQEQLKKYESEIAYFKSKEVSRVLRMNERGPTTQIRELRRALTHPTDVSN